VSVWLSVTGGEYLGTIVGADEKTTLPSALNVGVEEIAAISPLPKYSPDVPSGSGALAVGKTAVLPHSA
jgi:hypothetical protein